MFTLENFFIRHPEGNLKKKIEELGHQQYRNTYSQKKPPLSLADCVKYGVQKAIYAAVSFYYLMIRVRPFK